MVELEIGRICGQPSAIHGGRLKTTNIISAESIRCNRQQAKISQIADLSKIQFELPDDDKENGWTAQSETLSVTDSVLEHCTNEHPPIIDSTVNSSEQQPRHTSPSPHSRAAASPAKSLGQQLASMTIDGNRRYPVSPVAKSLDQKLVPITLNDLVAVSPSRSYRRPGYRQNLVRCFVPKLAK